MVRRLDPTMDPQEFGFPTPAAMMKPLEGISVEVKKGEFDQMVRLKVAASV